jgi:RNA polymerase sigma-70 factor (ECF subfamily)
MAADDSAATDARDAAWMALVAQGDVAAFRALFETYVVSLVRLAAGYVRSDDAAKDVVQDVFVALWERRGALVITGRVSAYLAAATRNRALKTVRTVGRAARWEGESARMRDIEYPVANNLGEASLEAEAFREALRNAVEEMPARQREVFLLHREQGLDYATIAAALGVTVPSVHNTMSRALARLRDALRGG